MSRIHNSIRLVALSLILCFNLFSIKNISAQNGILVDKIIAIVDDKVILKSDIENQINLLGDDVEDNEDARCLMLDQLIANRLLTTQAAIDSTLMVSDEEVEEELERKVNYYISMIGSKEKFEQYYGKPLDEIKSDFNDDIRDQMLAQRMRDKILEDIKVIPSEVREYFNSIPKDSLPYFNTEFEITQLVIKSKVSPEQKQAAYNKISEIKKRLDEGEDFELLATLYSDDPGSAKEGGDLGWATRGTFVPEFEDAAFTLENGKISGIIETTFGYHILQLIERKGEQVHARHILIAPQSTTSDMLRAKNKIDSIRSEVLKNTISFASAVSKFSDDDEADNTGGRLMDYQTGSTLLEPNQIDPELYRIIDTMKVGTISEPLFFTMGDGSQALRIVLLETRSEPHVASLATDFGRISMVSEELKRQKTIDNWMKKKSLKSYILIDDSYQKCDILHKWLHQ